MHNHILPQKMLRSANCKDYKRGTGLEIGTNTYTMQRVTRAYKTYGQTYFYVCVYIIIKLLFLRVYDNLIQLIIWVTQSYSELLRVTQSYSFCTNFK